MCLFSVECSVGFLLLGAARTYTYKNQLSRKLMMFFCFFSVPAQRDNIWGPFLIISPASTLNNWHQEFTRFVPKFKVRSIFQISEHNNRNISKNMSEEILASSFLLLSLGFCSPLMNLVLFCSCEKCCQISESKHTSYSEMQKYRKLSVRGQYCIRAFEVLLKLTAMDLYNC